MDERRRYFRIEDTIALRYEILDDAEARQKQIEIERGDFDKANQLQATERQLQLLIDKLRVQSPEFADAVALLNSKFNLLKEQMPVNRDERAKVLRTSISACGLRVNLNERLREGEILLLDITLLPTDIHIHTLAEVMGCETLDEPGEWSVSADFTDLPHETEELLVQHIVKRQGRILAEERQIR